MAAVLTTVVFLHREVERNVIYFPNFLPVQEWGFGDVRPQYRAAMAITMTDSSGRPVTKPVEEYHRTRIGFIEILRIRMADE